MGSFFFRRRQGAMVLGTLRFILVAAVIHHGRCEIADALIEEARHHGLFGQLHHAVVQHDGGAGAAHSPAAKSSAAATATCRRAPATSIVGVGHGHFGFDVIRKGRDVFDEGAGRVDARGAEVLAGAEFLNVAGKEARHFDDRSAPSLQRKRPPGTT